MDVKNFVAERCKELLALPHCCPEAKQACQSWLDAVGTAAEAEAAKALITELEEDVMTVDDLIAFGKSEAAIKHFGAEQAAAIVKQGEDAKAAGVNHCPCDACSTAYKILEKKAELLA